MPVLMELVQYCHRVFFVSRRELLDMTPAVRQFRLHLYAGSSIWQLSIQVWSSLTRGLSHLIRWSGAKLPFKFDFCTKHKVSSWHRDDCGFSHKCGDCKLRDSIEKQGGVQARCLYQERFLTVWSNECRQSTCLVMPLPNRLRDSRHNLGWI